MNTFDPFVLLMKQFFLVFPLSAYYFFILSPFLWIPYYFSISFDALVARRAWRRTHASAQSEWGRGYLIALASDGQISLQVSL